MSRSGRPGSDQPARNRSFWWAALVVCLGCADAPTERPHPSASMAGEPGVRPTTGPAVRETWAIHYLRNPKTGVRRKVGYRHVVARRVVEDGLERTRTEALEVLQLARFGTVTEIRLKAWSLEMFDGTPVRFAYDVDMQPAAQRVHGEITSGRLHGTLVTGGRTTSTTRPWPARAGGLFAVEQSLRRQPMRPGERRTIECLQSIPILGDIAAAPLLATVELAAEEAEDVALLAGTLRLLRIRSETVLPTAGSIHTTLWTDRRGEILKAVADAMGQETFRTTREVALKEAHTADLDLGWDTLIRLDRPLPGPHATRRAEYVVTVRDGDPEAVFASCLAQQVCPISEHTAWVVVRSVRPDQPRDASPASRAAGDDDLRPNGMIQSDDARVVAMAQAVANAQRDPWKLAVALEEHVHRSLAAVDFSQVLASAADVARSRRGDCTEYAVLLAAVCRARGIPARVAIGLVYVEQYGGFLYHMWDEVWIKDRWIPLDATLGKGGIGAAHLKFADSNLKGASAYAGLLPIAEVVGRLTIDLVRVE